MASGVVSAARMMISLMPLFKVLVASFAPFLSYKKFSECSISKEKGSIPGGSGLPAGPGRGFPG